MFLKIYFIVILIWFMDLLKCCFRGVRVVFLKGFCKCICKGYVGLL